MRKMIDGILGFVISAILLVLLIRFGFALGNGTDKTESLRICAWRAPRGDISEEEES